MQEGFSDPPSVSSISRLLRGGRPGDDGKKDYTINGILGGSKSEFFCTFFTEFYFKKFACALRSV